jgi:hypothetical protein
MRKRIWVPLVLILVVCLLLLVKTKQHHGITLPEQSSAPTNQPSQPEQPKALENHQIPNDARTTTVPPVAVLPTGASRSSNATGSGLLTEWQAPIEFYGKTMDENSNSVAGVNIHFRWSEIPAEDGMRTADTQSDSEGLFSLSGKHGRSLTVWFNKDGYYSSHKGQNSFTYALGPDIITPDPRNPIIFHLKKKGQGVELITSDNGVRPNVWVRVPKDNSPVYLDFFQKQASATGQLEVSQNKPPFHVATNWSFSLSIPDGGLIENQDEFQFEAPEKGYQSTVEYNFTKDDPNWTTQVAKQFYFYFGNPRKYGWLRIESNLAQETIFITYAINPTGSQNLEPAN